MGQTLWRALRNHKKVDIPREKEDLDRDDIIRPKEMPHPYTMYAVFLDGRFLTDDINQNLETIFKGKDIL